MMNSLRLVGFGMSVMALTAVCPVGVNAQVSPRDPVYACVRLERSPRQGVSLRLVAREQPCRPNEARMLVVASRMMNFFAHSSNPVSPSSAGISDRALVSKITAINISVPASAPLFLAITLQVNTDRGMFTIPGPSTGRGKSSSLDCVPLVDGQRAGAAQRLSSTAEAAGMGSVTGMFDPRTGGFDQLSPGLFPDTMWSVLREYPDASAGRHEVAVQCEARAAFHFRGVATLIALQPVQ